MSDSIWSDGGRIQMPQYEKLTRIKKVDVTIVGGGLCGLPGSVRGGRPVGTPRRNMWSSMCVFLKGGGSGMSAS